MGEHFTLVTFLCCMCGLIGVLAGFTAATIAYKKAIKKRNKIWLK